MTGGQHPSHENRQDRPEHRAALEALWQSHAMLARTERIANLGSWEWDIASDTVRWSETLFRIFQRDPADGAPSYAEHSQLYVAEDMERLRAAVLECTAHGMPYELELRAIRRDGAIRHCIARGRAERDAKGAIIRLVGSLQDITDRHEAQEALRANNRYLQAILQTTADGFWVVDMNRRIVEVNRAYCDLLGYDRDELLRLSVEQIEAEESPEETTQRMARVMRVGSEVFQTRHRRKDGSIFPVEVSCTFLDEHGGRFVSFCRDLTERTHAEDRLTLLARMLDAAPASITIHGTDGRFVYCNQQTLRLHGYPSKEAFLAVALEELDVPESAELIEERMRQIAESGEARFESSHYRADGTIVPLEVLAKRMEWQGRPAVLSIATDISERKRAEAERERLQSELKHVQKLESIGRLAGGVAHDFNNMLGVILGHVELALDHLDPPAPLRASLEEIRSAAQRSADLTRQLLGFARRQTIKPQVLDLNATLASMLSMLGRLIGEDIRLAWHPSVESDRVRIDPSQLDQVLANLCVNARDAIGVSGGTITIETQRAVLDPVNRAEHAGAIPGDYVRLTIRDDGCGMDADTLDNIFEPFYTTKGIGAGTGLGLATVYGIIKQNDGFIHVESRPGHGTCFRIHLPRYTAEHPLPGPAPAPLPTTGTETILLVEDEAAILRMTALMLERKGYRVLGAVTPRKALELARAHAAEIDLLITDVVMPGTNGRDLAIELRALCPDLKCLFMSGHTSDVIARHGLLDDGVSFIQKPFSGKALTQKIRETLRDT